MPKNSSQKLLAQKQHLAVREFLNQEPHRSNLLEGVTQETEFKILEMLLSKRRFVASEDIIQFSSVECVTSVSEAAKRVNRYLREFSRKFCALRAKRIVIKIPREKGGWHFGYYLACFNTKTRKYLDAPATRTLFANIWKHEIKDKLLKQLEEEANLFLCNRFERLEDYQVLEIAVGIVGDKKRRKQWSFLGELFGIANPFRVHNRVWDPFSWDYLLNPEGDYILSSDVGTGKTTLLRYLQLKIAQKTSPIPIFLHASKIEEWKPINRSDFIQHLSKNVNIKTKGDQIGRFLEEAFDKKQVFLLIDGLDQIRGVGTEYRQLIKKISQLSCGQTIIASRPSAVRSEENNESFTFLRLMPLNERSQKSYFGRHYDQARRLSEGFRELITVPMLAYMLRTLIEKECDIGLRSRAALYRRFVDYIFNEYEHDEAKLSPDLEIQTHWGLRVISYNALDQKTPLTGRIPLDFCYQQVINTPVKMKYLTKYGLVNLLVERIGSIDKYLCFTHQSFQEYLAAEWVAKHVERIRHVLDEKWNPKWREVIKFLAGILGEDFLKCIYDSQCEDDSIHSRLFLAAECCGELYQPCESHKTIFNVLRELTTRAPFEEDALIALSRLRYPEAVDYLVDMAGKACHANYVPSMTLCMGESISGHILSLVQNSILPSHIDLLLDRLEKNEDGNEPTDAVHMLASVKESLTTEHLNRMIDMECSGTLTGREPSEGWYLLVPKLTPTHIDQIFKLISGGGESARFRLMKLAATITSSLARSIIEDRKQKGNNSRSDNGDSISASELVPSFKAHIETLMDSIEAGDKLADLEAGRTMVALAATGILTRSQTNWLINAIRTGSASCQRRLIDEHRSVLDGLCKSYITKIIDIFINHTDPDMQRYGLDCLYPENSEIRGERLAKIVDALDEDRCESSIYVLRLLETNRCVLTAKQIDRVIDMVIAKNKSLSEIAMGAASCFVGSMKPPQSDRILEQFGRLDPGEKYTSILSKRMFGIHAGEPYLPVPNKLTRDQIKRISNWLKDTHGHKQKLAIELLANLGSSLPHKYCRQIVGLLSITEPDVARIALGSLGLLVDILRDSDTQKIIDCLNSQHHDVRKAAANYLKKAKDRLSQDHIDSILDILKDQDPDIAYNVLTILAEIPERMRRQASEAIVAGLRSKNDIEHSDPRAVAAFANWHDRARIVEYVQKDDSRSREWAIRVLQHAGELISGDLFDKIIEFTQNRKSGATWAAKCYIDKMTNRLSIEHVATVMKHYKTAPNNKYLQKLLRKIPSALLSEHVDTFVAMLGHPDASVQRHAWESVIGLADKLRPNHIECLEKLLHNSGIGIQIRAYQCLKKSHELCGLLS